MALKAHIAHTATPAAPSLPTHASPPPSSAPATATSTATSTATTTALRVDPLALTTSVSSPLYLGPCMLRHRQGQLVMSANCIYVRWDVKDEEIASLFPPPPRADMRQYARELGLQLRLSSMVDVSGDKLVQAESRPPLRNQPTFTSAASASGVSAGVPVLPSSATLPPLTRLSSASVRSASTSFAAGGYGHTVTAAAAPPHPPERPIALSELPSPRLGHYLGAASMRTITASSTLTPATPQPQPHTHTHTIAHQRQRRHSLDTADELQVMQSQQRHLRTSTEATAQHSHANGNQLHEHENDEDDQEQWEEVEEDEAEWDPSGALSTGRVQNGGIASNRHASAFAFDLESSNALTI